MPTRVVFSILLAHTIVTSMIIAQQDDEFNAPAPGGQWHWIRENSPMWRMTGSQLEINTEFGALNGTPVDIPATNSLRNILLQPAPSGTFRVETRLAFSPDTNFQNAGLIYYLDDDNYIRVSRGVFGINNGVWMEWEVDGKTLMRIIDPVHVASLYLRLSRTNTTTFSATYSLDGMTWALIGTETILFSPTLPHPGVGLQAGNGIGVTVPDTSIPAYFDYFRFALTDVGQDPSIVEEFYLSHPYPNPLVRTGREQPILQTIVRISKPGDARITIHDQLGRRIREYTYAIEPGGEIVTIPVTDLQRGYYYLLIEIDRHASIRRFSLE